MMQFKKTDAWLEELLKGLPKEERDSVKHAIKLRLMESFNDGVDTVYDYLEGRYDPFADMIPSRRGHPPSVRS